MEEAPPDLRHRPLVFVADLDRPRLDPADHHHLARVLRVRAGAPVTLGDGRGRWREARFGADPEPTSPIGTTPPADPVVTVGFVAVKGEGPEWYVQKLTEVGVDRIVPLVSERSVVRWDDHRAARHEERMATVAREASMQCRRLWLPVVDPVVTLTAYLEQRRAAGEGVALADPGGGPLTAAHTSVVIGPEGGFTDGELALADRVALPGHILRAPTAAVVAAALVCGLRSGLIRPPDR